MEVLVECESSPGMFSDEVVVQVAGREFLVPSDRVRKGKDGSVVRAKLVHAHDGEWVVLPTVYSDAVSRAQVHVVRA